MNYYVQHWLEKESDPFKFIEHFRCTTEPIGGGTEYDKEGELVDYEVAITAIKMALNERMLDRACEWLNKILYIHTEKEEDKDWGTTNTIDWVTSDYDTVEDFITAFRQAMEGE